MNKSIARNQRMAREDPRAAVKYGLLDGGTHALKFVMKSAELVEAWFKPEIFD